MDDVKRQKYEQALEVFKQAPHYPWKQLMVAICLTQMGKYPNARHFYGLAIRGFLEDRRAWHGSSEPNLLVDTFVLANQPALYPQVLEEIKIYKLDPRTESPVTFYAYTLVQLIAGRDAEIGNCIPGLLKKPRNKWAFAIGKTAESIIMRDQSAFDVALGDLLRVHRGMAKFGGLRETPEGFLCLPAMSLSKMAQERDLEINVESEYLSKRYLDYLLQEQIPSL